MLVLERVESFLPQMASANDELRKEMESIPVQEFDIEQVDASLENVIEMVSIVYVCQIKCPYIFKTIEDVLSTL